MQGNIYCYSLRPVTSGNADGRGSAHSSASLHPHSEFHCMLAVLGPVTWAFARKAMGVWATQI